MQWWQDMKGAEAKWEGPGAVPVAPPPANAWVINLYVDFFKAKDLTVLLQSLKDGAPRQDVCNLDKLDSLGKIPHY